ncbi:hypothetical protein QJS10_CPB11g01813 [Acorus calamus]|uniref:Uncharacterized protein n=1 Tax=Acorus calamus TaxID=4465 RepID=A0AAV9DXK7_ACOCL|nr:hypothetical protein QJS10_CPB11g01813 [Acorus calamus]
MGMDTEELEGLYEVIGGLLDDPNWSDLHPDPCTDTPWPGIQCELDQPSLLLHVTRLHIGPDVSGSPPCKPHPNLSPKSLSKLPFLKTLSLFQCFTNTTIRASLSPSLFTNSSVLEQLVLNSNTGLVGEVPSSLSEVKTLRVLSLSQNGLYGEIPREIGGLKKLEQLDLSYNSFNGEIPSEIGLMESLTILDLSFNGLQGMVPHSIGLLGSLQKIDLSSNNLSGRLPPQMDPIRIEGPPILLMEDNPVNTGLPLFLGELKELTVLSLSSCGFTGQIPWFIGSMKRLSALTLDKNGLNGSIPINIEGLPELNQLNLSQNRLTGEISFNTEFVRRLGKRLDVRGNNGLCFTNNEVLVLEQVPACLDANDNKSSNTHNMSTSGVGPPDPVKLRPSSDNVKGETSEKIWIRW